MYEITNTTAAPYASVVYLRSVWKDGSSTRASGVIVGENDVLTALHTVFDPTLGWATNVTVIPGTDTVPFFTSPFGSYSNVGLMVGRAATWDLDGDGLLTQQESAGDIALLGMTTRIGDGTGWLPVIETSHDFNGLMVGYPAVNARQTPTGMMAEVVTAMTSPWASVYDITSGLGAGASGGPLLETVNGVTYVAGVLSSGNGDESYSTYGGLYDPATMAWLKKAIADNDTLMHIAPGGARTDSPTVLMGTGTADTLGAASAWDVFYGLGGNDTITGGAGTDTAVYSGPRSGYTITHLASGSLQVKDALASRDGTDLVTNVERLHFNDSWVAFDFTGDAGQAYRLYQAAFNRTPDAAGLGYHVALRDDGASLETDATGFLASPEFLKIYGSAVDDTQFITLLYRNVLQRDPDAQGLQDHLHELALGLSRAGLLAHFSESPECQALVMGVIENGINYIV
jgi:V8-like Glu-specific endopeptidase